jgi:RNA polymerase-associated protein LEO1
MPSTANPSAIHVFKGDFDTISDHVASKIMQRVKSTIRHKQGTTQSNAQVVEWSDGTRSLCIGDLLYDLTEQLQSFSSVAVQVARDTDAHGHPVEFYATQGTVKQAWISKASGVEQLLHRASHLTLTDRTSPLSVKKKSMKMTHTVDVDPEVKRKELEKFENEKERTRKRQEQKERTRKFREISKTTRSSLVDVYGYGEDEEEEDDLDNAWGEYDGRRPPRRRGDEYDDEDEVVEEVEADEPGGEWKASSSGRKRWRGQHKQRETIVTSEEDIAEAPETPLAKKKRRVIADRDDE